MIDLDDFKTLNDTRGHRVGDAALIVVGALLSESLPPSAVAARIGGEEFVIAELADPAVAAARARALCEAIAATEFAITASIGVASTPLTAQTRPTGNLELVEYLMDFADTAMYDAKRAGGHQVRRATHPGTPQTSHTPSPHSGTLTTTQPLHPDHAKAAARHPKSEAEVIALVAFPALAASGTEPEAGGAMQAQLAVDRAIPARALRFPVGDVTFGDDLLVLGDQVGHPPGQLLGGSGGGGLVRRLRGVVAPDHLPQHPGGLSSSAAVS